MDSLSGITRRRFIKRTAITGATLTVLNPLLASSLDAESVRSNAHPKVFLFSKHLQFLEYADMCEAAKEMGFDGIDLTVRPKGHVLPEYVEADLPVATEAMRHYGLIPQMLSTNVLDAHDTNQLKVLEIASQLGYQFYRPEWIRYNLDKDIKITLELANQQFEALADLNKRLGIKASYQNHSGRFMGAAIWDLYRIIENIPSSYFGSQYDIMHATVEGGMNWEVGFQLIKPWINTIVVKDFIWKKTNGKWQPHHVPMGTGMVDFNRFFSLIKQHKLDVPISLHVEHDLGGAEHGGKPGIERKEVFNRIAKDLAFLRKVWAEIQ